MERKQALGLLKQFLKRENLIKHSLATEACMRNLARRLHQDEKSWALAGLLHDLDYEETKNDFSRHGLVAAQKLEKEGVAKEILDAIEAHSGLKERRTLMEKALYAVDPLTGLIVASALMHPEKKLKALDTGFVLRRFGEKHFARGANREQIRSCSEIGLSLEEFVALCLQAMQEIAEELGL